MGSLLLAPAIFSVTKAFFATCHAAGRAAKQAAERIPRAAQQRLERLESLLATDIPAYKSSRDFTGILQQQLSVAKATLEPDGMGKYAAYVAAKTSPLGQFISSKAWHQLALGELDTDTMLQQAQEGYRRTVAQSLKNAAKQAGFSVLGKEKDVAVDGKRYLSVSDGEGHGLRVAIAETDETQIAIDPWGYGAGECENKIEEIIKALKEEGIRLKRQKIIHHHDPKGFQKTTKQSTAKTMQSEAQQQNVIRRRKQQLVRS